MKFPWPRSLFGRVVLILFLGLAAAHVLSFSLVLQERGQASRAMMLSYFAKDVATAVAMLERLSTSERAAWLIKFERSNYRYALESVSDLQPDDSASGRQLLRATSKALGSRYRVSMNTRPQSDALWMELALTDGTPLTITVLQPKMTISRWVVVVLTAQLALLVLFSWVAVRIASRPLAELAAAADALGPDMKSLPLAEDGPEEVARAATAFNAMQRRIADHIAERMQILAAISHDLQTPITRMRLRADLLDNPALRDKLCGDLDGMQVLVEAGIAYARSAHGVTEAPCQTDLHALLDSIVCDYGDAGKPVRLAGSTHRPIATRPNTLRRIVSNLVDNALKFASDVEIVVEATPQNRISIAVCDRGPGIDESELAAVLKPFYRIEASRNRETGGAGLGLAIAHQLTVALGGTLTLANRVGGGLEVRVTLPGDDPAGAR